MALEKLQRIGQEAVNYYGNLKSNEDSNSHVALVENIKHLYGDMLGEGVSGYNVERWLGYRDMPGARHLAEAGVPHVDVKVSTGEIIRLRCLADTDNGEFTRLAIDYYFLEPSVECPWKNKIKNRTSIVIIA